MKGTVHVLEPRLHLKVRGPAGTSIEVEAVIDTGFSGWLTLSPTTIAFLGLEVRGPGRAKLADGSEVVFDAQVIWDRKSRRVFVDEADSTPLIGMSLLNGFELNIQVRPGGTVTIRPLPNRRGRSH